MQIRTKAKYVLSAVCLLSLESLTVGWFDWGSQKVEVKDQTPPPAPPARLLQWDELVREGLDLHSKYMHGKARDHIVNAARLHPSRQKEIVYALLDKTRQLLSSEDARDEVGARGILDSAMAVAQMLMDPETIYTVSNEFLAAGAPPAALEGYRFVLKLLPDLASAYHQIGLTLSDSCDDGLCSYAISYNNIGVLLSKMGRIEEALSHYLAAVEIDEGYQDAQNNVKAARAQLEQNEREASIRKLNAGMFSDLFSKMPVEASEEMVRASLRRLISEAETRRRRVPHGPGVLDEDLRKSVTAELPRVVHVRDAEALFDLATLLMDLQSYQEAALVYSRVTHLVPAAASGHHQLGLALAKMGETTKALEAYQRALGSQGAGAVSWNNIGVLLSKMGRLEEALDYCTTAHTMDPSYHEAADNIAAVHRLSSHYKDLVHHHQAPALSLPDYSSPQEVPVTVAGYRRAGDGLGAHTQHIESLLGQWRRVRAYTLAGGAGNESTSFEVEAVADGAGLGGGVTLVVVEPYRLEAARSATEYRVYLTVFESDRLPGSWVEVLNKEASEVWTTHAWLLDAFRASGLHLPVKILPIGTDQTPLDPPWHASHSSGAFTFLVLANMQPRKAVVETAESFIAAFGDDPAVRLRVHSKWGDVEVMQGMESFKRFSNVHVTVGTLVDDEYAHLWREADCVVSLSKGEGWGQVPREALGHGLPVIVSGLPCWDDLRAHSAQLGRGQGRAYFVETRGRVEAQYGFTAEDVGHFLTVDPAEARAVMRQVYSDYRSQPRRPPEASDVSPSWPAVVELYAEELGKEVLIFTRSLGTSCGISTYTYDMLGTMPRTAFARTWAEVFALTRLFRPRVLHVQHEHGLHWDEKEFLLTLRAYQAAHPDVALVVTLHTLHLFDPPRVQFYKHVSSMAHMIVLNEAAVGLLSFPARHIHHGVHPYRVPPTRIRRLNHAASFGFWDEEKRHGELCALAEASGLAIDLYAQPPGYMGTHQCEGLVTFHRAFLPTKHLLSALSDYTLLVFLRRPSHRVYAVSGSAHLALTAGVPILCEESSHFSDLAPAVELLPLADLPRRMRDIARNHTLREEMVRRQAAFAAARGTEWVQARHREVYESAVPLEREADAPGEAPEPWEGDVTVSQESLRLAAAYNQLADGSLRALPGVTDPRSA